MALPSPRRLLKCALVLAAAAAFPARAGVPTRDADGIPLRWDLEIEQPNVIGGRIAYYLDPLTSVEEPPGDETERVAIQAAAAEWENAPGGRVGFVEDTHGVAYARNAKDRVNYVGWKRFALSPLTLAATYVTAAGGVITDADVIFNDTTEFVKWATETPGLPGYADVRAVAAHELGHVLGLDHSPVASATMSAALPVGSIAARTLSPDDAGALVEAYPSVSQPNLGFVFGRVRVGRRPAGRGIAVFALDARTGEALGSALTEDDGVYRIHGLPPGPYRVAAGPLAAPGSYSPWWSVAPGRIQAAFHGEEGTVAAPRTVFVPPEFPVTKVDLRLRRFPRDGPSEPDDGPAEATGILPGEAAAGAFEVPQDEDWFRVTPHGSDLIDVRVRAAGIGADADPEVAILAADGTTVLAASVDLRAPVDPDFFHGPLGTDRDAGIAGFAPPGPGDLFVRVRAQPQSSATGAPSFYLLEVAPSARVPDAALSTASVDPPYARTGGGPVPVLSVTPRDWRGDTVGPGAAVTAFRSDGGPDFDLPYLGADAYGAPVAGLAFPGTLVFSIRVDAPRGSVDLPDAAALAVAGPRDAARSAFTASPRRAETGAEEPVLLVYTPRDFGGRLLGPGLPVEFLFDGPPAGDLGPVLDRGDGTYAADLLPAGLPSSARVAVVDGGEPTGVSRLVGFGWDLPLVAADLGAAVVEAQGKPGVSRRESLVFGRARVSLDGILAGLAGGDEEGAAAAAARAVAVIARAGRSPRFPDGAGAAADLAEALRRRAHLLIDAVVFPSPDPKGQAILDAAKGILTSGDAALDRADPARAARFFVAALRRAAPVL